MEQLIDNNIVVTEANEQNHLLVVDGFYRGGVPTEDLGINSERRAPQSDTRCMLCDSLRTQRLCVEYSMISPVG